MKNKCTDSGFSAIELLIVVTAAVILAGLAVPQLMPVRTAANEGAAIASVRQLMNAEANYSVTHSGGFAELDKLAETGLIDGNLADGEAHGYEFEIEPQGSEGYSITATPKSESQMIQRSFYGDHTGVIRATNDGTQPTSASTPISSAAPSVSLIPDDGN